MEADQDVAAYGVEKEKIRENAKRKKDSTLDMMKNSIRLEQEKREKERLYEQEVSILVNQKKILNMGEESKLRCQQYRINK